MEWSLSEFSSSSALASPWCGSSRKYRRRDMALDFVIGLFVAGGLGAFLLYSLLYPERF